MTSPRYAAAKRNVVTLLATAAVVFTARTSLADHYFVPTGSMEPTVHVGDRIAVNKLAYEVRVPVADVYAFERSGPSRGDVVVLESPEDGRVLLKRVVAVPGDTVAIRDGVAFIDGVRVVDPHAVTDTVDGGGPDFGPTRVPEDRYLVLGDNRGNSKDSRMFGFVAGQRILGRALGVFMRDGKVDWHAL
ncbi:MAG: Signal peptidase [Myxococcaceae bacterium]|nr:Signal peptidase [Myxococcaceae bacterium]